MSEILKKTQGKHILAYTGVSSEQDQDIQNQCIATGDGIEYSKLQINPVITAKNVPFEFIPTDFRDPQLWKKDGKFYMACVLKQKNLKGGLVMFESPDLKNSNYFFTEFFGILTLREFKYSFCSFVIL